MCVNGRMHPEHSALDNGQPSTIAARATVQVDVLDVRGLAVAHVETWNDFPDDELWRMVMGSQNIAPTRPERCEFVGGLPGERHEVEFRWLLPRAKRRKRRVPAPHVRSRCVLTAASDRAQPTCPVFGECGGCQLQHLEYASQLVWKTQRVAHALAQVALADISVAPAIGCTPPWHYRNHMRFSVNRAGQPGLTARGSHRVLPLRACPIASPRINQALAVMANTPCRQPQLLIRCGTATGQVLLQPIPEEPTRAQLVETGLDVRTDTIIELLQIPPNVPAARGARVDVGGRQTIAFRIRPSSFFQTNTEQANQMAAAVLAGMPTGPEATLVDAYCGVGTFAALLAPHAGRVIAIEESASAIRDAQWNLREFAHVTVLQAKVEAVLPTLSERLDGLVIDPPRAGCQRPVLEALLARRIARVVYVSCEPSTLARDIAILCDGGAYRVLWVQPLDMFPQTAHIETIVTLEAN